MGQYSEADSNEAFSEGLALHLMEIGLRRPQARVLAYLLLHGGSTAGEIAADLAIDEAFLKKILGFLAFKGVIMATYTRPLLYSAIPYEDIIAIRLQEEIATVKQANVRLRKHLLEYMMNKVHKKNSSL